MHGVLSYADTLCQCYSLTLSSVLKFDKGNMHVFKVKIPTKYGPNLAFNRTLSYHNLGGIYNYTDGKILVIMICIKGGLSLII